MIVQARVALDGGGVYAVEVEPDELKAQLADERARFLEFADPAGFVTAIPREKVLMVQYGPGIPSPEAQAAQQQAQLQQMQQQYAQMQQQYQQMQAQMPNAGSGQSGFGERAKAKLQQFQDQFMSPQPQFMPPQQQQFPSQQSGQNPMQW
ncbi:MAG: hypothetical protein IJ087_22255 [Eggerthellaceae bacterium]|nr:hypothetical protein [Eggerthellaceae bacterium]